jgi:hypothetical protein
MKLLCFIVVGCDRFYTAPFMRMRICNMRKYLLSELCILCVLMCLWLLVVYFIWSGESFCLLCYAARPCCYCLRVGLVPFFVVFMWRYLVFNSCNASNIGLWTSVCVSFMCSLFLLILYRQHFSNVLRWFPLFSYICFHFYFLFSFPIFYFFTLFAHVTDTHAHRGARVVGR